LVREFWDNVSPQDPRLLANGGHPVLLEPDYKDKCVPLWFHGDAVSYTESDPLMVFSFGSILTSTNSMLAMFYIASFVKSVTAFQDKHKEDTWHELWKIILWSLVACWHGVHPALDWTNSPFPPQSKFHGKAGQPLCKGFKFLIWNIIGDLEFFANVLGMPHWRNASLCFACDCTQADGERPYTKNWAGKLWNLYSAQLFHFISRRNHPVFDLPGVTSWSCCWDTLHALDTKGLASHMCGSSLRQMVYEKANGRAAHDELARVWQQCQIIYDQLGVSDRMTHLQLSMLCNVDKPHADYVSLHAKGSEVRHLVPVLAVLTQQECNGSAVSLSRVAALKALTKFYAICDQQPMFMSQEASDAALQHMEIFLAHYTYLHNLAVAAGRWYYNTVYKEHFCWHLAYDARFMNPRYKWTYKAESWVGKISHITASCASGTRLTKITVPLADKYRLYAHVRLNRLVFED